MKYYFIYIVVVVLSLTKSIAQVDYVELMQPSKNTAKEYPLFFIDFWATWCGPCSYATTYIDNLQQKFPTLFYVATLSEEQPYLIKKYLKKHPTKLAVYADFNGQTFKRYNVKMLPHGIVLNAKGDVVWTGNPTDFSANKLTYLLRKNKNKTSVETLFNYFKPIEEVDIENEYLPKNDFELTVNQNTSAHYFNINYIEDYVHITGTVQSVLAYSNQLLTSQVEVSSDKNKIISVYVKSNLLPFLSRLILNKLNFKVEKRVEQKEALVYEVSNSRFWNKNQINWNDANLKFLIGEDVIEADNVTFKSLAYQVSKALDVPFVVNGYYNKEELHDWQLHYQFFDLMKSALDDTYGVLVTKKVVNVTILTVQYR